MVGGCSLKNKESFRGKAVCELGAGMTAMAGLALGAVVPLRRLYLTDGNEDSAVCIKENVELNRAALATSDSAGSASGAEAVDVRGGVLVWDRNDPLDGEAGQYDVLIAADCLFFDDYHDDLIHVIKTLLRPTPPRGEAIIMGPRRGKTLDLFCERAEASGLRIEKHERYDDEVGVSSSPIPCIMSLTCSLCCRRRGDCYLIGVE